MKMKPVGGEMIEMPRRVLSLEALEASVLRNEVGSFGYEKLRKVMQTKNSEVASLILALGADEIIKICMQQYLGFANDKGDMERRIRREIEMLKQLATGKCFPAVRALVAAVLARGRN